MGATFGALMFVARVSYADGVAVGDYLHFLGSYGSTGGGAFLISNTTSPGEDFLTFCLQDDQFIDYQTLFQVVSITDYSDDPAGPDYLAPETTWIFSHFRRGLLPAFSSDEVQAAIWTLEDESTIPLGNSAELLTLAYASVANGWSNDGVRVLNLIYSDDFTPAQAQLTYTRLQDTWDSSPVPEPGSLALLGTGLVSLKWLAKRARQQGVGAFEVVRKPDAAVPKPGR